MYLYGTNRLPEIEDKFLYHFTKAGSLMEILKSMTLKLSTFTNLNDLNEANVCCEWSNSMDSYVIKKYILEHCKLISFSQNYNSVDRKVCYAGANHPRLWAQYADDNSGACIVINEELFKSINKDALRNFFWKIENVEYKERLYDKNVQTCSADSDKFIRDHYKHVFFKKHIDWQSEHERRFFGINAPDFLSISGCIQFICFGERFSNENFNNVAKIIADNKNKCNQQLMPHDFVIQTNADGRILLLDCASRIISAVQSNERDCEYLHSLQKKGYDIRW